MNSGTYLAAIFAVVAASGCASTPDALKQDASNKREVTLPIGYQTVLKRLVEHEQKCGHRPLLPVGSMVNEVSHYPDLRTARIVRGAEGIGRDVRMVIELDEPAASTTRMAMYFMFRPDAGAARLVEVANGRADC